MPTACSFYGYIRAGTLNDRLGKSLPPVRATCPPSASANVYTHVSTHHAALGPLRSRVRARKAHARSTACSHRGVCGRLARKAAMSAALRAGGPRNSGMGMCMRHAYRCVCIRMSVQQTCLYSCTVDCTVTLWSVWGGLLARWRCHQYNTQAVRAIVCPPHRLTRLAAISALYRLCRWRVCCAGLDMPVLHMSASAGAFHRCVLHLTYTCLYTCLQGARGSVITASALHPTGHQSS